MSNNVSVIEPIAECALRNPSVDIAQQTGSQSTRTAYVIRGGATHDPRDTGSGHDRLPQQLSTLEHSRVPTALPQRGRGHGTCRPAAKSNRSIVGLLAPLSTDPRHSRDPLAFAGAESHLWRSRHVSRAYGAEIWSPRDPGGASSRDVRTIATLT